MLTILITCFIVLARSGQIFSHDILMSPNNISSDTDITFIFTLDTQLAPSDYLRIVLPFQLNPIESAYWDTFVNCSTSGPTKLAAAVASTISGDDSGAYFAQFYTDLTGTKLASLAANTTYFLRITGNLSSSTSGIVNPVQLLTVSNNVGSWITYDSNPVFGTLSLAPAATSELNITTSIPASQTDSTTPGADYIIDIDVSPTVTIENQARIDFELTNQDFGLLSCQSVDAPDLNTAALPATFQPLNLYTLRATIPETFSAANFPTYRFQCVVKNPVDAPASSSITVTTMMGYVETIVETETSAVALQSTPLVDSSLGWDETVHQVQLGWGYQASSASAAPIFSLYRDASATEVWYQSVKTIFQPESDLMTTNKLRLNMTTVSDTGFRVLTATIQHNLPDYSSDEPVTCTPQPEGVIICDNVGQLQANTYFISFRFNIAFGGTATTVPDFGKVLVQDFVTSQVLLPLSTTGLTNAFISNNVPLFTNSGADGIIANSISAATSNESTYVTNGEDVILKFSFNYFTSSVIPVTSTSEINQGIEFYTSNGLVSSVTPNCSIDTLTQSVDVVLTDCSVTQASQYTLLRFRLAEFVRITGPPAALFTATPSNGVIRFNSVNFNSSQFSSFNYVNENVYDYYVRWVQGFTASTPSVATATGSSPFFFNSVVYTDGALANVQVGATFFANAANNTGVDFPTLIRVTGYLAPSEQVTADRLMIFFNDLEPLDTQNPCFGPTGIVCTYSENGIDNTQTDSLTDYSGSRRVVIDMDLTQKFNIYIPVTTIAGQSNIGFFIATASSIDSIIPGSSNQGIFATQFSRRIAQVQYASNAPTVAAPSATTPLVTIPASTSIGAVINTTIGNIQGTYLVATPNTNTTFGAAYGYCANYDFTIQSGFALQPFYNTTSTPQELCVNIQYQADATRQVTCQVCPVDSAMVNSTVNITNFQAPSTTGQDYLDALFVVGSSDGNFQAAARDNQATVFTPFNLTNVSITFTPNDFKKSSNNIYATLNFTLAASLPQSVRVNIVPASSSLYMTPVSTVGCDLTTLDFTSCSASGSPTGIQLDVVITDDAWPMGEHSIMFMVDASQANALTSDTVVDYNVTIQVNGIGATTTPLNSLHDVSGTQNYTILDAANSVFMLQNVSYLFGNKGAKTVVSLSFALPDDMIMYSGQSITFNLWGISTSSAAETASCIVRDTLTLQVSNSFGSCNASNLPQVLLAPKEAVSGSFILEIGFVLVPNSAMPAITAEITAVDGVTAIADNTTGILLPTAPASTVTPASNVQLTKTYTNPGSVAEFTLAYIPSVSSIALTTSLYIYFPSYYAEKLGYENLWCTANDLPVSCFISGSWLLEVTSFPETIQVGQTVDIKIYGIITPQNTNAVGTIFIGLGNGDNTFQLIEQIEIQDTAAYTGTPLALTIETAFLSNNYTRETTNLSFSFTTTTTNIIQESQIISIDLPDEYGGGLRGQTGPLVSLSQTGDSTELAQIQSDAFGSRLKLSMPLDLNPLTSYTFTILNLETPDYPMCNMDRPTVSIMQTGETRAVFRSAPNIWDAYNFTFINNPNFEALNWVDDAGDIVMKLTLTVGIMSEELRITPPYGENFYVDINFTTSATNLTILPASGVMTAVQGSPYFSLRLGASINTAPTIIELAFNKTEGGNSNYYSKIPKIEVTLTNNMQTIPTSNTFRIMKGGFSLPLAWDLGALNLIPQTELKIEASIADSFSSILSSAGTSTLTFGPTTPQAGFNFILSNVSDATNPPSITLSLDGVDQANYQLANNTVQIEIIDAVDSAPVLSGLTVGNGSNFTTQKFTFNLDQMAPVYWHVAYQNNLSTTDCLRVRDKYEGGAQFDPNSANQEQYGAFYVYNETQQNQFEIGNLLTNQGYSYILCPVNQLDYMATSINGTFTTQDNQAALFEVVVTFTRSITRAQLTSLVCLFAQQLQLPNANVVAMDGTTCSVPSTFVDFTIFNYTQVSIFIQGNRRSDYNSTTRTLLTQYITSITTQTSSKFSTLFASTLHAADLKPDFQSISLQAGPIYPYPVLNESAILSVSVTDTTATLSGLQLVSGEGVFYAIASEGILTLPTQSQIKSGVNASNTAAVSSNVVFTSSPVALTLTNLEPETDYIVYYFANSGDRTQYALMSKVKYVQITTAPTRSLSGGRLGLNGMLMLVITVIMVLIS